MMRVSTRMAWMALVAVALSRPVRGQVGDQAWIRLFDGHSLDGWKASEHTGTFSVRDGTIVAHGDRSHLFYVGPVQDAEFTDFELKVDVLTKPGSNGGIYFHTVYQETDWPRKGFEAQVNNSYTRDPRKTGSLYRMQDVAVSPARDNEWFTEHVIVRGKHVVIKVDGRTVVDWREPSPARPPEKVPGRVLGSGTFALQGHDPNSTVYYKNIYVKPLPALGFPIVDYHVHLKGGLTIDDAIEDADRRGIKFGVAVNCGVGFPISGDEGLLKFLESVEGRPVYTAVQAEGREWVNLVSEEVLARFDYVFTDSMTWTNDRGRRMRLWIPREVEVGDKEEFMDMLVDRAVGILTKEPIDIYVNPTYLPAEIADEYDALWTDERMDRVIRAAVRNGVAIEINSRFRLPSERFIRRAKAAGAKFSFGTNNGGAGDLGQLAYSRLMARRCGLTKADMFVPKPNGQKAIQRKPLPRR